MLFSLKLQTFPRWASGLSFLGRWLFAVLFIVLLIGSAVSRAAASEEKNGQIEEENEARVDGVEVFYSPGPLSPGELSAMSHLRGVGFSDRPRLEARGPDRCGCGPARSHSDPPRLLRHVCSA